MIYVLLWLLLGSLSMNYLWIQNHKKLLDDLNQSKGRQAYKSKPYLKGLLIGLVSGPLGILVQKGIVVYNNWYVKKERLKAIDRKRGNAQKVKK